jgi:hypothetical protein
MQAYLDTALMGPALLLLLTVAIYIVILIVFIYARMKYQGGLIEQVIKLIIGTIGFLLVSDIALFLTPGYGFLTAYTVSVIFKIVALIVLAIGGLRFFVR